MIIPDELVEDVEKKFRVVYTYKDEAKEANRSATEVINEIADLLDKEKTKASKKHFKKVAKKAYTEWVARNMGDNSSDDASVITTQIFLKNDVVL